MRGCRCCCARWTVCSRHKTTSRRGRAAGREQMTLRVLGDAPAAVETPRDHAGDETLGPGARYLTARRAEWRRAREAPELTPLRPALAPVVRAERVTRHDAPPLLASV